MSTNKYRSINFSKVVNENRLDPKFFFFMDKKEKLINKNSNYTIVQLGNKEYFPLVSDGIHSAVNLKKEGTVRYLYVHNLKEGLIDTIDTLYLDEKDHMKNLSKELKKDYVLLSVVGTLGHTALFSDYIDQACSLPRNIAYIKTNKSKILPEYLTVFFLSKFSKEQCIYSSGGNVQGLLSLTKLKKMIVPIPDMSIQKDLAIKYRSIISKEKEALNKIKQAQDILYSELSLNINSIDKSYNFSLNSSLLKASSIWTPKYFYPFYDNVFNTFKNSSDLIKLGDICSNIKSGDEVGSENYSDYFSKSSTDVPFIRTSDFTNYEIDLYPDFYIDKSIYNDLNQQLNKNDILITKDGNVGAIALCTEKDECILASGILKLTVNNNYNPYYIFLALTLPEIMMFQVNQRTVITSTIPHLKEGQLREFKVPVLKDNNKIQKIASLVEESFKLKNEKKELLMKLKAEINNLF